MTCFSMGVLHGLEHLQEKLQALAVSRAGVRRTSPSAARPAHTPSPGRAALADRPRHRRDARYGDARGCARMSRSRAKRCSRPACARASIGSFSATSRLKAPSARRASHTSAMPPAPSSRISSIRPHACTGLEAARGWGARLIRRNAELRQAHQRLQIRCLHRSGSSASRSAAARSWCSAGEPSSQARRAGLIQRQRLVQQLAHPRHLGNR